MPFTPDQFAEVFRRYNEAVWPAQVLLHGLGLALVPLALSRGGLQRGVPVVLALLWAWSGVVYHLAFFSTINPMARVFGAVFVVQALVWIAWAVRSRPTFRPRLDARGIAGGVLFAYALVLYPLLNTALGHAYPRMPTFGAPCPTTIASFAVLAWADERPPWWVWIAPLSWALVGTSAALVLGVPEDLGLPIGACVAVACHARRARPQSDVGLTNW